VKRSIDILSSADVDNLVRACSRRYPTGKRNAALISTLYATGIRIGECLAIRPKDVHLGDGYIRLQTTKGDRPRTVGLNSGVAAIIKLWLDARKELPNLKNPKSSPIFCSLKGAVLDQSYIRKLLPRLAAKAGIEGRVHAHCFRHSRAHQLSMEGTPMPVIQRILGHESLSTTSIYLSHISPRDVIQVMQAIEWTPPEIGSQQRAFA